MGLREADSPARAVLPRLRSQTLLSLRINQFPFYLDPSQLRAKSLSTLFSWLISVTSAPESLGLSVFPQTAQYPFSLSQAGDPAIWFPPW